jgi:hypothetical protein
MLSKKTGPTELNSTSPGKWPGLVEKKQREPVDPAVAKLYLQVVQQLHAHIRTGPHHTAFRVGYISQYSRRWADVGYCDRFGEDYLLCNSPLPWVVTANIHSVMASKTPVPMVTCTRTHYKQLTAGTPHHQPVSTCLTASPLQNNTSKHEPGSVQQRHKAMASCSG